MKTMYIMRGLPGSGKSTLAQSLASVREWESSFIASADNYFMTEAGYVWEPRLIGEAHAWCRGLAEGFCTAACHGDKIVIDNTNIHVADFASYLAIAAKTGFDVEIIEPDNAWSWDVFECYKRNVHGVPLATIKRMKERYEPYVYQ